MLLLNRHLLHPLRSNCCLFYWPLKDGSLLELDCSGNRTLDLLHEWSHKSDMRFNQLSWPDRILVKQEKMWRTNERHVIVWRQITSQQLKDNRDEQVHLSEPGWTGAAISSKYQHNWDRCKWSIYLNSSTLQLWTNAAWHHEHMATFRRQQRHFIVFSLRQYTQK